MKRTLPILPLLSILALLTPTALAGPITWHSPALDKELAYEVTPPESPAPNTPLPVVIYLRHLATPRLGREPDAAILRDLTAAGHLVLQLDYANDPRAKAPDLTPDILALRQDLTVKQPRLLADHKVDPAHIFILPEGFRLRRDVTFAQDGTRTLAMDIMYPADPPKRVGTLMEITCDNANRMGTGSLLFCRDTLLESGMLSGFAVAMIDHPVAPPYKGIDDPMPESIHRLKAAVRTLRSLSTELPLNGQIGAMGFSRGGPMAALLAVPPGRPDLDGAGPHPETSSRIQAALIHGNRYDFLHLNPDDPMLKRFEKAWGPLDTNRDRWAAHGPAFYLTPDAAPMFLNTSDAESREYQDQLALFASQLTAQGVEHVYQVDKDGRGHRVTTAPTTLNAIYEFFHKHLDAPPATAHSTTNP